MTEATLKLALFGVGLMLIGAAIPIRCSFTMRYATMSVGAALYLLSLWLRSG